MRFCFVDAEKARQPVGLLDRCLGGLELGLPRLAMSAFDSSPQEEGRLQVRIAAARAESRGTYGSPRIVATFRMAGTREFKLSFRLHRCPGF